MNSLFNSPKYLLTIKILANSENYKKLLFGYTHYPQFCPQFFLHYSQVDEFLLFFIWEGTMWGKRGHRGDALEELLYYTNQYYHQLGLCRVDKISTPIKVIDIDHQGMITKGFFEKKSTVDFIGIAQGVCLAFDAKETNLKSLPLQNIHSHQIEYMKDIDAQGGLAFIIIHFKFNDEFYLVPYEMIADYYTKESTRRSIPYKAMLKEFQIKKERSGSILNYLETLNTYVSYKETLKKE